MATAALPSPEAQAKGLRIASRALVAAGLLVGLGLPAIFWFQKISVAMTPSGFDLVWLLFLAIMLVDFGLAGWLARRATAIERSIPPA